MKKFIYPMFVLGILVVTSCSKSDNAPEMMDPMDDPMGEAVTYEADVRGIIQNNCLSCHSDPPVNGAPMPLTTFAQVKEAVDNRGLVNRINSTTNPMPPTGRMPSNTRQIIQDWVDQGAPEN